MPKGCSWRRVGGAGPRAGKRCEGGSLPARVLGTASGLQLARGSPLCFYAGLLGGSGKLFH